MSLWYSGEKFSVHFSSDYENQLWGFELVASAEVDASLRDRLLSRACDYVVTRRQVEEALAVCCNDCVAAQALLDCERERSALKKAPSKCCGLYCSVSAPAVRVNLQLHEVYLAERMLRPVPHEVATHEVFVEVFGERAGHLYCAVASRTTNRQLLKLVLKDAAYDVAAWRPALSVGAVASRTFAQEPLAQWSRSKHATAARYEPGESAELVTAGAAKRALNAPQPEGARNVRFGHTTFVPYAPAQHGDLGWVAERFEAALADALAAVTSDLQQPQLFIQHDAAQVASANEDTLSSRDEEDLGEVTCRLLLFLPPQGKSRAAKLGNPGCWFEVVALRRWQIIEVWALLDVGRRCARSHVYSSKSPLALAALRQSARDRPTRWPRGDSVNCLLEFRIYTRISAFHTP